MEKEFVSLIDEEDLPTFVHPRAFSKYLCNICMEIYKEPVRFLCGHFLCKTCFGSYKQSKHNQNEVSCATCRVPSPVVAIEEDKMFYKILPRLLVYCKNLDKGCKWKGSWMNLQEHEGDCQALLIPEYLRDCEEEAKLKAQLREEMKHAKESVRKMWAELIPEDNLLQRIAKKKESNKNLIESTLGGGKTSKGSIISLQNNQDYNEDSNKDEKNVFAFLEGLGNSRSKPG